MLISAAIPWDLPQVLICRALHLHSTSCLPQKRPKPDEDIDRQMAAQTAAEAPQVLMCLHKGSLCEGDWLSCTAPSLPAKVP